MFILCWHFFKTKQPNQSRIVPYSHAPTFLAFPINFDPTNLCCPITRWVHTSSCVCGVAMLTKYKHHPAIIQSEHRAHCNRYKLLVVYAQWIPPHCVGSVGLLAAPAAMRCSWAPRYGVWMVANLYYAQRAARHSEKPAARKLFAHRMRENAVFEMWRLIHYLHRAHKHTHTRNMHPAYGQVL